MRSSQLECFSSIFTGLNASIAFFFFFKDTAPTEIYTLPLHDALPICPVEVHDAVGAREAPRPRPRADGARAAPPAHAAQRQRHGGPAGGDSGVAQRPWRRGGQGDPPDRKSTRLNSSHSQISYAVFCLK